MVLYEDKRFNLLELIEYLNNLENKSKVLEITLNGNEIQTSYNMNGKVIDLVVMEPTGNLGFAEEPYNYNNYLEGIGLQDILYDRFDLKICGWKEIDVYEMMLFIVRNEDVKFAFSIESEPDEIYEIENLEETLVALKEGLADGEEIEFFKAID